MNTPISQPSDSEPAQQTLFELPPEAAGRPVEKREDPPPKPRLQRAERRQMEWLPMTLDDLIPPGHAARSVWEFVEHMDLTGLYARIAAVEGRPGRDTIDPKILMALWLYATIDGVGMPESSTISASGTTPTVGFAEACRSTTTRWPIFARRRWPCWINC